MSALGTTLGVAGPVVRGGASRILVAFGTRPEAIKLAPVVHELRACPWADLRVVATAQHRHLLDQVLTFFGVSVDVDLDLMRGDQSLADLTSRMLPAVDRVLEAERPDVVLAQGDTTTVMVTGLACFYRGVPFAHVEAGLRTGRREAPFPEEMNRAMLGWLADLHFAPTETARANLLRENVAEDRIHVTGNTVIDALLWAADRADSTASRLLGDERRRILVTAHRRESFGPPLAAICDAVRDIVDARDVEVVFPVHPNPNVQAAVHGKLSGHPRIRLLPPLDYPQFVAAMKGSYLILTDSGGVQEEAPSLGVPVLVLRDVTERTEGIEAGTARLVGPHRDRIVRAALQLLDDPGEYARMARTSNPYGDGQAARRIAAVLEGFVRVGAGGA